MGLSLQLHVAVLCAGIAECVLPVLLAHFGQPLYCVSDVIGLLNHCN